MIYYIKGWIGMIIFKIDEFSPCLKEIATGEIYDTEVVRIRRKLFS